MGKKAKHIKEQDVIRLLVHWIMNDVYFYPVENEEHAEALARQELREFLEKND